MPRRVATPAARPPAAPSSTTAPRRPASASTTTVWSAGPRRTTAETPLDRWHRLHAPVVDVPERKTPVTARARAMAEKVSTSGSRLTPRLAQDMMDSLTAFGLAEPVWPHLAGMGFREEEAATVRAQLKSFDNDRRTSTRSLTGVVGLAQKAVVVEGLSRAVRSLLADRPLDVSGLQEPLKTVARNGARLGPQEHLRALSVLLDEHLMQFITDAPSDLVEAPPTVKQALETSIAAQTRAVRDAEDGGALAVLVHEGFTAFGQLRELAVLDPVAAQKAGAAFLQALRATEARTGTRALE